MKQLDRRRFIRNGSAFAAACAILPGETAVWASEKDSQPKPQIHLFSKHLQFLHLREAAEVTAELGFEGMDLTLREGGHVPPEVAERELPVAMEAIKAGGSSCCIITTALDNAGPEAVKILETAAGLGIKYYRSNWFRYPPDISQEAALKDFATTLGRLSEVNKKLGLTGCYQNHSGLYIGASLWEIKQLLQACNPDAFGLQYDIRHATVEGGQSWPNGLQLMHDRIRTLVLKDFKWAMEAGKWKPVNTPLGEGMVDFSSYFKLLKKYRIEVPWILHLEYPLGGAEHGKKTVSIPKKEIYRAMKTDLQKLRRLWEES